MQQVTYMIKADSNQSAKHPVFTSLKNIIVLLKKSLPSLGIDKKNRIFERLDSILKEAEKNDEKVLKKEYEGLILATL